MTSVTLRQTQPPPRLQLTKYYFQPQIDDLDQHQIEVRAFGAAALQEWYKGLDKRGQALIKECARFEQWQLGNPSPPRTNPVSMGLVNGSTSPAYSMASSAMYSHQVFMESPTGHSPLKAPLYTQALLQVRNQASLSLRALLPLQSLKTDFQLQGRNSTFQGHFICHSRIMVSHLVKSRNSIIH